MKKLVLAIGIAAALGVNSAQADQVILDDLIVDGSICAGMDCVNGEAFGFDTIRLKENNLRIMAVDTSSTSSFPSRDWQITFNDSSNGGLNKFSIDDIDGGRTPFTLEAGAPSHSLYVDDAGRLGLGTSTPVVDVHVKSGNTPTQRLEQDGSSGFTAQTWDVAGNEANFFVRDATNGSTLPFRIFPGAPSDALDIAASGDVGIGTESPGYDLEVERSGQVNMALTDSAGESWVMVVDSTGTNEGFSITRAGSGAREFRIDNAGNVYVSSTQVHPDYVFEPDYKVMPLADLAKFVLENKHLPDVQSAADVNEHGLNISTLPSQLLKKVEELTLYTIDQEKTISNLQSRLEQLESSLTIHN